MKQILPMHNLRNKLIIAFLVLAMLPLIATSLYGNWTTSRTLEAEAIAAAQTDLRQRARQIEGYLAGVRYDLLFLSHDNDVTTFINWADNPTLTAQIETLFSDYLTTHPGIFQIRYLNEHGQEVVRVEGIPQPTVIPATALQNKSSRYYFQTTMQIDQGEVFVSPVDLNREFGLIQTPYTPTIRYATPLFYENGQRAGILILNLFAQPFLDFVRIDNPADATITLIDQAGYYLVHPDSIKEWSGPFDLNTGISAATDYPDKWETIQNSLSGVLEPPPENWLQALSLALLPQGIFQNSRLERRVLVYESVNIGSDANSQMWLINDSPQVSLLASVSTFRITALSILTLTFLIAIGMAVGLAHTLTKPILQLTEEVRRFGSGRVNYQPKAGQAGLQDEVAELSAVFQEMSLALDQHMNRLSLLNQAGHHITARLDSDAVMSAVETAVNRLFPANYLIITRNDDIILTHGEKTWAIHRRNPIIRARLQAPSSYTNWFATPLDPAFGPAGFLCCAPICIGGEPGLIELYGDNPTLKRVVTGELLSTLAIQLSIALDNAELYAEIKERGIELQNLVEMLINAQEEERRMVAFDIHDGLIQMLVGIRLQLRNFLAERTSNPTHAEAALNKGVDQLAAAIVEARRVIEGLRPAALDDLGLVSTIRLVAEEARQKSNCELEFEAQVMDYGRLPETVEITAFRIMQEAITNARKYAHMTRLRVAIQQKNGNLHLEVRDWGRGFHLHTQTNGKGVGLISMAERARLLGGTCEISSTPGKGSIVRATLPIPQPS